LESVKGLESIPGFEVKILPNPVQDIATLQMDSEKSNDVTITLWDMNGQQLQSRILRKFNGIELLEMNVANYPNGNYLVSFQIEGSIMARQLVIQK